MNDTFACKVSGEGEAAIALIDVFGPDARSVVESLTGRPVSERPALRRIGDEVMVRFEPRGFTGEPTVVISCHGGDQGWRAVMRELGARGVAAIDARGMTRRAWRLGAVDRAQAEAYWVLPKARTLLAAKMLADQFAGALSRELRDGTNLDTIVARARLGIALTHPPKVALVGPPNAGKSTLLNALVQRERAIVSPVPGTTRDPVSELTAIEGVPIELIDTAGVEQARDPIEAESIERTFRRARAADLVLSVAEAGSASPLAGLRVWTKCDLALPDASAPGVAVCAPRGDGLDELRREILRALAIDPSTWGAGQGIPFTPAQLDAIRRDPKSFLASPPELE